MIPLLLLYKILQLFVAMALGFILVKLKLLKSADSTVLSRLSLYVLMPSAIINAFNIELTPSISKGIALAFLSAFILNGVLMLVDVVFKRLCHASGVERASVAYPNAANLIIPIVSFVLGEEWVVYSCAFMTVQLLFLWTHGIKLFTGKLNLKKIITNINIIAILVGAVLMVTGLKLPQFALDITASFGSMIGNIGMVIAGMMAAQVNFKETLSKKRLYLVAAMRMIICPFLTLVAVKLLLIAFDVPNAERILLISYLASISPSAATVMQFALLYSDEGDYSVAINIVTTVLCILTMPIFAALY